jgi:uncharacterized protein involved in exopolysaccharide biosynthesis
MSDRPSPRELSIAEVVAPVRERLRHIIAFAAVAAAAIGTFLGLRPAAFVATQVLAPVSAQPSGLNLGGAAALLGARGGVGGSSGLQVSSDLVANLVRSRRVLEKVGSSPVAEGVRLVDQVRGRSVEASQVAPTLSRLLRVRVDEQTGFINLEVVQRDSAVARMIAERLVQAVSETYVEVSRAQASEMRRAQDVRVDSARRRLAAIEGEIAELDRSNRATAAYGASAIERLRLQREQGIADQVYSRAVLDRESAIAKELEQTPVVVVVDPLPHILPARPRRAVQAALLTFIGVFGLTATATLVLRAAGPQSA